MNGRQSADPAPEPVATAWPRTLLFTTDGSAVVRRGGGLAAQLQRWPPPASGVAGSRRAAAWPPLLAVGKGTTSRFHSVLTAYLLQEFIILYN
jgi:hypothetical protein